MTKVVFLLLFLSTSTAPQYYYKGMWFHNMQECEDRKEHQINKMMMEAEILHAHASFDPSMETASFGI